MMDFLPPPTTPDLHLKSEPIRSRTRNLDHTLTVETLRLFASTSITELSFETPERRALEECLIHAIDLQLNGKRRPIAQAAPADQARSSRAQLPLLLAHLSRSRSSGRSSAPNEAARRRKDRFHDKQTLTSWASDAGILIDQLLACFQRDDTIPLDIERQAEQGHGEVFEMATHSSSNLGHLIGGKSKQTNQ